jgi:hypothetical protein
MKDEFNYRSSKTILEQTLKGAPPVITYPPVLSLEYGEVLVLPHSDGGWRQYGKLKLNGKTILKGMFSRKGIKRNKSVETVEPHGNV